MIIIFFCIILLFSGVAYSILNQKIKLIGKVSIGNEDNIIQNYNVTYIIENKWYSNGKYYYKISMTLHNNTNEQLNGWKISIKAPENAQIMTYSNTDCIFLKDKIEFNNVSYNAQVPAKSKVTFEFQIATTDPYYKPSNIIINGDIIAPPEKPEFPEEIEKKASITIKKQNSWQSNGLFFSQLNVILKNTGDTEILTWKFDIKFDGNTDIEQIWNANIQKNDERQYTFSNSTYNGIISPDGEINFGFIVKSTIEQSNFEAININLK